MDFRKEGIFYREQELFFVGPIGVLMIYFLVRKSGVQKIKVEPGILKVGVMSGVVGDNVKAERVKEICKCI